VLDFVDLDALASRITAFEEHCRQTATPFDWNFTSAKLTATPFDWNFTSAKLEALLARLADRGPHLKLAA
jgi:hypothetical protein